MGKSLIGRRVTMSNNGSYFYLKGGKIIDYKNNLYIIVIDNGYNDIVSCKEDQFRLFGDY